jgi:hypothetical protein
VSVHLRPISIEFGRDGGHRSWLNVCELRENWPSEGSTAFFMNASCITLERKSYEYFKLKNAVVKHVHCCTNWLLVILWNVLIMWRHIFVTTEPAAWVKMPVAFILSFVHKTVPMNSTRHGDAWVKGVFWSHYYNCLYWDFIFCKNVAFNFSLHSIKHFHRRRTLLVSYESFNLTYWCRCCRMLVSTVNTGSATDRKLNWFAAFYADRASHWCHRRLALFLRT